MHSLWRGAVLLLAAVGVSEGAHAQRASSSDTVLLRLTSEALAGNAGLGGLAARTRASSLRVGSAGALGDPTLSVTMLDLTLPRFGFRESDFTEVDVEVRQAIPWPGTLRARVLAAEANRTAQVAMTGAMSREIVGRVADYYFRLRYLRAARETLRSQRALLDAVLEIATARYAVGSSPQSDPLAARLNRARLSSEEAALTAEEAGLRAQLAAIRGKKAPDSLTIAPLDPAEVFRLYPTLDAHPHGGPEEVERHPLLEVRRAEIASAEATARTQKLEARPGLELMARYGARPIASDFLTAGVGFRLPLWGSRAQRTLAAASQQEAEAGRGALREQLAALTAEYWSSIADATAGLERLRVLLQEVIPTAEATREAAMRSYRTGSGDFSSVLTALDTVYRVRLEASELAAHHLSHLIMLEQLTKEDGAP